MAGGRIGGQGPMYQRAIWVFIAACIVVAVLNTFPHDPKGFYKELQHKSDQLKGVAGDVVDWLPFVDQQSDATDPPSKTGNTKKHPKTGNTKTPSR